MIVIIQEWLESERGWGVRPDGISIHKTLSDCDIFCKKYWEKQPKDGNIPDEYSRESGKPFIAELDDIDMINRLMTSEVGFFMCQYDYSQFLKSNKIKKL